MLINFIGAPCSGKTTTAARLFAELKDSGYPAEFVSEQARRYIAEFNSVKLSDVDQVAIMGRQYKEEKLLAKSNELVVCDSSLLNSLLYMTPQARELPAVQEMVDWAKVNYGIVFLCQTVKPHLAGPDPHRVHSWEESLQIEAKIKDTLATYVPNIKAVELIGDTKYRTTEALRKVYSVVYKAGYGPSQNS